MKRDLFTNTWRPTGTLDESRKNQRKTSYQNKTEFIREEIKWKNKTLLIFETLARSPCQQINETRVTLILNSTEEKRRLAIKLSFSTETNSPLLKNNRAPFYSKKFYFPFVP